LGPFDPAISEKIVFKLFFAEFSIFSNGSHLGWWGGGGGEIVGHNSERGPPTQGPFHQSLVQIGPVVLEELVKMQKANDRRTTNAQ
jgi:hypothetical protein